MKKTLFLVALALLSLTASAQQPLLKTHVETGDVQGILDGTDLAVFKAIPYAAPPVGDLRWRAPQPAQPLPATPPANTAAPTATEFFTVQFLSTADDLKSGAPEFQGLTDVMMVRNGKLFCYSVGRFATFAEASEYCKKLQKETPFKDAWALRRAADKVTYLDGTSSTPAAPTTPAAPAAAPTTTPAATTPSQSGVIYRVQIFTSKKVLKADAPELQGIKDFHRDPYGKVYIYSVGNYKSLDEARKRAANIRATTPFKDAFVICFKNGKKITID